jgi:hypothetical protein
MLLIERRDMPPLGHFSLIRFRKEVGGVHHGNVDARAAAE